jgi:hypothetical protein
MDFIRGAALSRDGRPIIALPSTAKAGTISRVVPELAPGAGVVTTRGHVHWCWFQPRLLPRRFGRPGRLRCERAVLDETVNTPKRIMIFENGPGSELRFHGIYALEGDELRICLKR